MANIIFTRIIISYFTNVTRLKFCRFAITQPYWHWSHCWACQVLACKQRLVGIWKASTVIIAECFKTASSFGPAYVYISSPAQSLIIHAVLVPWTRTTRLGRRSVFIAAPVVWNSLPLHLRSPSISRSQLIRAPDSSFSGWHFTDPEDYWREIKPYYEGVFVNHFTMITFCWSLRLFSKTIIVFLPCDAMHIVRTAGASFLSLRHGVKSAWRNSFTAPGRLEYLVQHCTITHITLHCTAIHTLCMQHRTITRQDNSPILW